MLVNALDNRVADDLLKASTGVPLAPLLARLSQRLEDDLGLAENAARWAVETWALALGVIDQPMPTVSVIVAAAPIPTLPQEARITIPSSTTSGGKLCFPKFSVGVVVIGGQHIQAVGEINVPRGQAVELKVAEDVTEFHFLENCDPYGLVTVLDLKGVSKFHTGSLLHLKNFVNLKELDVSGNESLSGGFFYEKKWEPLVNFKSLTLLKLSGCQRMDRKAIEIISKISSLELLDLNMSKTYTSWIRDDALPHIANLPKLKTLDLRGCNEITGPGVLTHFGNMTHLQSLDLTGCRNINLFSSFLQELKSMLPNTRILP